MDNTRPPLAPDPEQAFTAMMKQRIYQRTVGMPWRRMHDHPRGLIDDDQVFVFKQDIQRQVLPDQLYRHRRRHAHLNQPVTLTQTMRRCRDHSIVNPHLPLDDQRFDARTTYVRKVLRKQMVEALAALILAHVQRQFLAIVKLFHGLDISHVASLESLAYR